MENNVIAFTRVKAPFGWMGNMSAFELEFEGRKFPTSEHLFMWLRIKEEFLPIKAKMLSLSNPMAAKKYIKAEIEKNPEMLKHQLQSTIDIELMKQVISLKLEQHPELQVELLKTNDAHIYEDVTSRCAVNSSSLFWGAAECCREIDGIDTFWVGQNVLGEIWMEARKQLSVVNKISKDDYISFEEFCLKIEWFDEITEGSRKLTGQYKTNVYSTNYGLSEDGYITPKSLVKDGIARVLYSNSIKKLQPDSNI